MFELKAKLAILASSNLSFFTNSIKITKAIYRTISFHKKQDRKIEAKYRYNKYITRIFSSDQRNLKRKHVFEIRMQGFTFEIIKTCVKNFTSTSD